MASDAIRFLGIDPTYYLAGDTLEFQLDGLVPTNARVGLFKDESLVKMADVSASGSYAIDIPLSCATAIYQVKIVDAESGETLNLEPVEIKSRLSSRFSSGNMNKYLEELPPAMIIPPEKPSPFMPGAAFREREITTAVRPISLRSYYRRQMRLKSHRLNDDPEELTTAAKTRDFEFIQGFRDDSPMKMPSDRDSLIAIEGFEFCSMYDRAIFRQHIPFYPVLSAEEEIHKNAQTTTIARFGARAFVHFAESVAKSILNDLALHRGRDLGLVEPEHAIRLACHLALEGRNQYVRFASQKLLQWVDGTIYYPNMGWAHPNVPFEIDLINVRDESATLIPKKFARPTLESGKPHYPLAFTILGHNNIEGLKYLIDQLEGPQVIIAIHIDQKAKKMHRLVEQMIQENYYRWDDRVFLTQQNYPARWGGAGIVYGQLAAYFELLERCTFEYVLNASPHDVPLMDTDLMYQWILDHGPDKSFMAPLSEFSYNGAQEVFERINRPPAFQSKDFKSLWADRNEKLRYLRIGSPENYHFWTAHQWTVLSYAFVFLMQHDPVAPTILIPFEWGFLLDELYFSVYAQWSPRLHDTINTHQTRCMCWAPGGSSPEKLDSSKLEMLHQCAHEEKLMTRKWHIDEQPWLAAEFESIRANVRAHYEEHGWKADNI